MPSEEARTQRIWGWKEAQLPRRQEREEGQGQLVEIRRDLNSTWTTLGSH